MGGDVPGNVEPTGEEWQPAFEMLMIAGQIEGHFRLDPDNKTTAYEVVLPQIVAMSDNPAVKGVFVLLHTPGGDVGAGLAIAEAIAGIGKPTVSFIAGHAHSIGLPIAVAAQESFMAPAASMLIHPVSRTGIILGVPQSLVEIQREQQLMIDFVYRHTRLKAGTYEHLMTATQNATEPGTFLTAGDCVEHGLIDQVGSLREGLLRLHELIGGAGNVSHGSNAGHHS